MRRLYLELRNQRFYFLVPPLILFVLVPLTVLATTKGAPDHFPECATISQLFIPSFAAWWPLFVMKEYLNSPGRELLFVYKSGLDNLCSRMIILWVLYVLHIVIIFIYYTSLFDFVWFLFIAVVVQSMFLIALAYFLSLLLRNTFLPLLVNFTYSSVFMLTMLDSPLSIFEIGEFDDPSCLDKPLVVAAIALALFYGGYQLERRFHRNGI